MCVRVISATTLRNYWVENPRVERPLREWLSAAEGADWATPKDIKAFDSSASILKNGRVVFNIAGNKYRLVAHIAYQFRTVLIKFIGSHADYDEIDAQTIDQKKWR